MSSSLKRTEIRLKGLVQGVLFRSRAKEEADVRGLTGWVRNEEDGSVCIIAEGEEDKLRIFIEWCKKGTEWSRVREITVQWHKATGEYDNFEIA